MTQLQGFEITSLRTLWEAAPRLRNHINIFAEVLRMKFINLYTYLLMNKWLLENTTTNCRGGFEQDIVSIHVI